MYLLAHVTQSEFAFFVAVFLVGLASGFTLGWSRSPETSRERKDD